MNALRTILAPLALLAAAPALAQTVASGPVVAAGNTLLTVSAEGRTERAPDLAVFNAGVTSQGKTAGEALSANSADMARVLAALKRAGIADRDVQTSQLSLNPIYAQQRPLPDGSYDPMGPKIVGYQASNQVTVRQRDLKSFGKVIDTLVEAGANQVNGPSFQMDDGDAAADAARIDAIKKARARAELYARAAGLRVVRILSIAEGGGYSPPPVYYARAEMAMDKAQAPVAPGEVTTSIGVTVMFELAP